MKKLIAAAAAAILAVGAMCSFALASTSKAGDVDFDSLVTAEDALLVLRYTAGTQELTSAQLTAADVTYDGTVNSVDALRILLYVSGSVPTLEKVGSEEGDDIII